MNVKSHQHLSIQYFDIKYRECVFWMISLFIAIMSLIYSTNKKKTNKNGSVSMYTRAKKMEEKRITSYYLLVYENRET